MSTQLVKRIVRTLKGLPLPLEARYAALNAVARAGNTILQGDFYDANGCICLAALAAFAARGESPSNIRRYFEAPKVADISEAGLVQLRDPFKVMSEALGISEDALHTLIDDWDSCTRSQCAAVVRRVRAHVDKLEARIIDLNLESLSHYVDPFAPRGRDDQQEEMRSLLGPKFREHAGLHESAVRVFV